MKIDPRKPGIEQMIHNGSDHEFHKDLYKTIGLLSLIVPEGPLYFVVEGISQFKSGQSEEDWLEGRRYWYEEHTCPTNFIRIEAIFLRDDSDPHGIFTLEDAVWMTPEYLAAKEAGEENEYLQEVFPQLRSALPPSGSQVKADRMKISMGRLLFDSIDDCYAAQRKGALDDFGSCETTLVDLDVVISEIKLLLTPKLCMMYLDTKPYVMSHPETAAAYRRRVREVL